MLDIADGVTHRPVAERLLQPGHARAVTHPGAAVDIVGVEHPAGKLLHHVVGLVPRPAGRAGGHDGPRAILRLDLPQPLRGIAYGLLPGDRHKPAALLVADHRLREARRQDAGVVEKVPAVIALQAQLVLVGHPLCRFGADDLIVLNDEF